MEGIFAYAFWIDADLDLNIQLGRTAQQNDLLLTLWPNGDVTLHELEPGWRGKWRFLGEGYVIADWQDIFWSVPPGQEIDDRTESIMSEVRRVFNTTTIGRHWKQHICKQDASL